MVQLYSAVQGCLTMLHRVKRKNTTMKTVLQWQRNSKTVRQQGMLIRTGWS